MAIDNYSQVEELMEKMDQCLPIPVKPGKQLLKLIKNNQGITINSDIQLEIQKIIYLGDDGGIMCSLSKIADLEKTYTVSLTHLKIDSNHPLAAEIQSYQHIRNKKLMAAAKQDFDSLLLQVQANQENPKKPRSKFGKGFQK